METTDDLIAELSDTASTAKAAAASVRRLADLKPHDLAEVLVEAAAITARVRKLQRRLSVIADEKEAAADKPE